MAKLRGFTLIEIIVGMAIFLIIAISAWEALNSVIELVRVSKIKVAAIALSNEQLEIVRNLPYADVGIINGSPSGKLTRDRKIIRDGIPFNARFTVRNVDDTSDGTFPDDLSPADYKSVEIEISCSTCRNFLPLRVTTTAAPKNLETASTNGALFVRSLDANGQPVAQANVNIINNNVSPHIDIDETTNNNGWLQLVDIKPSIESYAITVSKNSYSQEQTYPPGGTNNPNPTRPHATVALQQVTQISFAIDRVSTLNISSINEFCNPIGSIDFSMQGSKIIGTDPTVYKFQEDYVTTSGGQKSISNLEWDTYNISVTDSAYDLAGSQPLIPVSVNPNNTQDMFMVVKAKSPRAILVTVKDASTLLPLSNASVTLSKTGYSKTLISGEGYLRQTDWSGGSGQVNYTDETKFYAQDSNVNNSGYPGQLKLKKGSNNKYKASGWLESSTFDTGISSNFYNIIWQPLDQDNGTVVKFRIATSNVNPPSSWNYLGPDGTVNTYYTLTNTNINPIHNGNRYIRYKVFLTTSNDLKTPNVSDVALTFSSTCVPPGQAFFDTLSSSTYTLTVSHDGYQTKTESISTSSNNWQEKEITLSPSS